MIPGPLDAEVTKEARTSCLTTLTMPRGPSGHSLLTKARFASSLTSPFLVVTVAGGAKDIYLEKFGCDGYTLWVLFTIQLCWGPISSIILGHLQDKEYLSFIFPVSHWGRRAPWQLTHCILAAVAAGVIFLPPGSFGQFTTSTDVYHAWYFVMAGLAYWGYNGCITAFEAARQEIYPYKEERILVEGLCKYACMLGGGAGGLPYMLLLVNASLYYRLGASSFILCAGLVSLLSVSVMRQARSGRRDIVDKECGKVPEPAVEQRSLWREVLRPGSWNCALRHMMCMKFWNGAYGASIAQMLLYYITYVLRLQGTQRGAAILVAGLAAGLTESVFNVLYMWLFGSGDARSDTSGRGDRRLLNFVFCMRLLNAVSTVVVVFILPPSVYVLIVWACTCRIGIAGFTFWRVSAQCWLVDEDAAEGKERREATVFSSLAAVQAAAGALCGSLTFLGLTVMGLQTRNCEAICRHEGSEELWECISACTTEMIDSQPDSLRIYIRAVIGLWAPLCELLVAFHTYKFPIKGARLRRLYASVAERRGESADAGANEGVAAPRCSRKEALEHAADSKIVLQVESHPKEGLTESSVLRLAHALSIVNLFPGSKSHAVIFDVLEASRPMPQRPTEHSRAAIDGPSSLDLEEAEVASKHVAESAGNSTTACGDPPRAVSSPSTSGSNSPMAQGCQREPPTACGLEGVAKYVSGW